MSVVTSAVARFNGGAKLNGHPEYLEFPSERSIMVAHFGVHAGTHVCLSVCQSVSLSAGRSVRLSVCMSCIRMCFY